jgi:hypothetical protein
MDLTVLTSVRLAGQNLGISVLHGSAHSRDFLLILTVGRRQAGDNDRKTGIYSLIRIRLPVRDWMILREVGHGSKICLTLEYQAPSIY